MGRCCSRWFSSRSEADQTARTGTPGREEAVPEADGFGPAEMVGDCIYGNHIVRY